MYRVQRRRAGRETTWLLGACLAAALWVTPRASASVFGPAAFAPIRAGSTETVLLGVASPGADERELVLSLDGGRTFPVRLTREIEPGDRTATWRVPALPTEHAVLALREGGDESEEEIVATSAEFTILPAPAAPVEELQFRDGEWRTREADAGHRGLPLPSFGSTGPARWMSFDDVLPAFEEPVRALPAAPDAVAAPEGTTARSLFSGRTLTHSPPSRFLPLRE